MAQTRLEMGQNLREAIALYFEALYMCNVDLLDRVFHPASSLFDADAGAIFIDPITHYRQTIANRVSPASLGQVRQDEILFIDHLSDNAAMAKVRLRIHQNIFVDHLCYARSGECWQIVAKLWHLERTIEDLPPIDLES